MGKNRLLALLFLGGALVFFVDYRGWISALFLLLVLILPLFSLLFSLPYLFSLKPVLNAPAELSPEKTAEFEISLIPVRSWCDPLCSVSFRMTDKTGGDESVTRLSLSPHSPARLSFPALHFGIYELELTRGRLLDFLGLFRLPFRLSAGQRLTVYPQPQQPAAVPPLELFQALRYHPLPGGGFSEVHETREYRPGDSLNTIHWKLSAKTDSLIVREAQEKDRQHVLLVLSFSEDRSETDRILGEWLWISHELLGLDMIYTLAVPASEQEDALLVTVRSQDEEKAVLQRLLNRRLLPGSPEESLLPTADWRFDLNGKGGSHESL